MCFHCHLNMPGLAIAHGTQYTTGAPICFDWHESYSLLLPPIAVHAVADQEQPSLFACIHCKCCIRAGDSFLHWYVYVHWDDAHISMHYLGGSVGKLLQEETFRLGALRSLLRPCFG